jgi:MoaA/NifB/PqqE/SkfB family radical SAM enzyme
MVIEVGSECNRRCPWCPQSTNPREKGRLSDELYDKIIVDLAAAGYEDRIALHFFNEPLLDERLEELVRRAKKVLPGNKVYIHTNGDLLTIERWRSLREAGLDSVFLNQYDGKVSQRILDLQSAIGPDAAGHLRVRLFRARHVYNRAGLVKSRRKVPMEARCRRINQMCVDYRGNVVLCCNDYLGAVSVGNVADKDVIDLYNDPLLRHYREELRRGRRAGLKLCEKCDL